MTRQPTLDVSLLTPEQRKVHDQIIAGPRGEVVGPLRVWLHNPGLAATAQALGQYARYETSLPVILSELAILITARIWSSGFEWAHHAPIAQKAGLAPEVIASICKGERPPHLDDDRQRAVFDFAVELHRDRQVSDATYRNALAVLGQEAVIDLTGICGYYTLISMTINAFEVPDGDGPVLDPARIDANVCFR